MSLENISFSVVIPYKDRPIACLRALLSIEKQLCLPNEVIVIDDGSKQPFEAKGDFSFPVKVFHLPNNKGAAYARNFGVLHSSSDYILFLDSDDEWLPSHTKESLKTCIENETNGCFSSFIIKSKDQEFIPSLSSYTSRIGMAEYILGFQRGDVRTSTICMKRKSFIQVKFDEDLRKYQDWDLAIRFAKRFNLFHKKHPTVILHVDNMDRMSSKMDHYSTRLFYEKHQQDIVGSVADSFFSKLIYRCITNNQDFHHLKAYSKYGVDRTRSVIFRLAFKVIGIKFIYEKLIVPNFGTLKKVVKKYRN